MISSENSASTKIELEIKQQLSIRITLKIVKYLIMIIVPTIGGFANRIRGGWCHWLFCGPDGGNFFTHNFSGRLLFAFLTSLLILPLVIEKKKIINAALIFGTTLLLNFF